MKILKKENDKKELEQTALDLIMNQAEKFSMKSILMALRVVCDDTIELEELEDVIFNALEYCLSVGYIDIYDQFQYMVDPIKQTEYLNKHEDNVEI